MANPNQAPAAEALLTMFPCIGCGRELHITANACPGCGASQRSRRYKSRGIAALYAFFLGAFGGHRFYLGKWWGLLYLLFFWTGIPGLIAFGEMIVFLVRDQNWWDEKYNEGRPAGPNNKAGAGSIAVLAILGLTIFVAIAGILAAIAIPAYHEYMVRAKVAAVMVETQQHRDLVVEFARQHRLFPDSNIMLGIDEPTILAGGHQLLVDEGAVTIIFSSTEPSLGGKTFVLEPTRMGEGISWSCHGGTLEYLYKPARCRQ